MTRCAVCRFGFFGLWFGWLAASLAAAQDSRVEPDRGNPQAIDSRLAIERLVAEPDLVTPTGIDVAPDGRIFVIECHTHFRPDDYAGPTADRIRVFADTDGDGIPETASTFYEGTTATMNLAFAPDDSLWVATRNEIFRLRDTDGDGQADERTDIAGLETTGYYPHNGLSGFAFDLLGNVFFGFGENLGEPYTLVARDGTRLAGGGEGGSIFRIGLDGHGLERWATGFWNPFHLTCDDFGRLFAVDNDPDWRPPCRLLHVVRGGDYGYRFTLGRRGTHPFTAWFGDAPDRLGMIAGTGEAPSGVVSYRAANLPDDYQGDLLATSWGLHTIERYRLRPLGATWTSEAEIIVKGGEDFRPVGIATRPDGSLVISDWVKQSYPLHGHGRIWKLRGSGAGSVPESPAGPWQRAVQSADRKTVRVALQTVLQGSIDLRPQLREVATSGDETDWRRALVLSEWYRADGATDEWQEVIRECLSPTASNDLLVALAQFAPAAGLTLSDAFHRVPELATHPEAHAAWVRSVGDREVLPGLIGLLGSQDDWLQQAAISRLSQLTAGEDLHWDISEPDRLRLGMACVLARQGTPEARRHLPEILRDIDEEVRWVGLRWIGEAGLETFTDAVRAELKRDTLSARQFAAVLATLELLEGKRGAEFEQQQTAALSQMVTEPGRVADSVRPLALQMLAAAVRRDRLADLPPALQATRLIELLEVPDPRLQVAALRQLLAFHGTDEAVQQRLQVWARDTSLPLAVRLDAITGLADPTPLLELADADLPAVRHTALRTLAGLDRDESLQQTELPALANRLAQQRDDEGRQLVQRLLGRLDDQRPTDATALQDWFRWLDTVPTGRADEGERVFFSSVARCGTCHQVAGRGGVVGPDLSQAGEMDRNRLLESILQPSREVAPRYTAWVVETDSGEQQLGLLQTERGGDQFYVDAQGETFVVNHEEIVAQVASEQSLMPAELLDRLTAQEIADLLAYLDEQH